MALPHAAAQLDWVSLAALVRQYSDPGIELPVGVCGRIHLVDKHTAAQVDRRKYLKDRVCEREGCADNGLSVFRKNQRYTVALPDELPRTSREIVYAHPRVTRFAEALAALIERTGKELAAEHEVRRTSGESANHGGSQSDSMSDIGFRSDRFIALMEAGATDELLTHSHEEIWEVLDYRPGGQAVGNNLRFLLYHVLHVYLRTNLIVAFGLEQRPQDWGSMSPGTGLRQEVMRDCDGATFLPHARRELAEGVYLADARAAEDLVTACFRYLVHYELLCRVTGYQLDWAEHIRPELGLEPLSD
ncbi:hypothetical protein JK358_06130 [Nocardia sp. 2]|uniref:Uncharacterized protein n=1 Tax=Nocardia acididurans TaxID=2802282 RepID=A0ABS1LZX1_9NOCA|nr:hypothetical protein [Nocardia acididurans]MBL1073967.1 hypothetical protein [Nocardia acididurans]